MVTKAGAAAALCEGICRTRFRRVVARCVSVPRTDGIHTCERPLPDVGSMHLLCRSDVLCVVGSADGKGGVPDCDKEAGGTDRPHLMQPGSVYEVAIDLWDTAIRLQPGERLRVDISSSNFPRRN